MCLIFRCHLKSAPVGNWTQMYQWETRLFWYSDPPLYWAMEPMSFNNSSFWVEREDSQRMRAKLYQFNLIHIFNVFLIKMIQIVKTNHKKLRISNFANSGNLKIKNQILMNKRQSNITLKEIRTCAAFGSDSTTNNID